MLVKQIPLLHKPLVCSGRDDIRAVGIAMGQSESHTLERIGILSRRAGTQNDIYICFLKSNSF